MPERIDGRGTRRGGFTLPEVLVSVAMMAVLAAVLIPSVTGQIGKSETARVVQDLQGVDAAAQIFRTDIGRWPGSIAHLVTVITTGQSALVGGVYTTTEVAAWRGPYLALPAVGATLPSGGGTAVALAFGQSTLTSPIAAGSPENWLYVTVTFPDAAMAESVDLELDSGTTGDWHAAGRLRATTSTASTAYFFSVPAK